MADAAKVVDLVVAEDNLDTTILPPDTLYPPDTVRAPVGGSGLVTDHGRTIITDEVVAKIAGTAVREVRGVHSLVPTGRGQQVTALARRALGNSMRELGIQVEVGQRQAAVDVRIVTNYGASIVAIANGSRGRVREQIERMTGLEVVEVNIEVVDLFFPDQAEAGAGSRVQ